MTKRTPSLLTYPLPLPLPGCPSPRLTLYPSPPAKLFDRYRESKPVLDDKAYDALRKKLKDAGSQVVLHEAPSCKVRVGAGA
jgi:hypothetical protein